MNGRCAWYLTLVAILCVPAALHAQVASQDTFEPECVLPPMTTMEMRACAAADFLAADEELSEVLDSLRVLSTNPARFDSLQAAWVIQRDSTCVEETEEWGIGTIRPQMEADCRTRLIEERVAKLRAVGVPE